MSSCVIFEGKIKHPNKVAIVFENSYVTYLELDYWIKSTQLTIQEYKRISFVPLPLIESVVLIFAALRENIKICLLNHRNPLNYRKNIEHFFKSDLSISSLDDLVKLTEKNKLIQSPRAQITNEPNLYIPTSGTTSKPKIACLSYQNFIANALVANQKLGFSQSDTWILSLPLFHVAGLSILFRAFVAGATVNIAKDKDFFKLNGNFISLVPTQLNRVLDQASLYKNKFKCILMGGAPLSEFSFNRAKKLNLPIAMSYGMTETASQIFISKDPKLINGVFHLGYQDNHCDIHLNKKMELSVSGSSVFYNYYKEKGKLVCFKTQDILKYHKDYGYAFFARSNEMFISGGENIYPEEIERYIMKCNGIDVAYVVGVENVTYGHVPVAFIFGKNYDIDEIRKYLSLSLPKYKVPIEFFKIPLQSFNDLKCSRRNLKKHLETKKNLFVKLKKII